MIPDPFPAERFGKGWARRQLQAEVVFSDFPCLLLKKATIVECNMYSMSPDPFSYPWVGKGWLHQIYVIHKHTHTNKKKNNIKMH